MTRHAVDTIEDAGADLSRWARAVVAKRAALAGAITTLATAATALGLPHVTEASQYATTWLERAVIVAGAVAGIKWAHNAATPADPALAPRASDGARLVRVGTVRLALSAAVPSADPAGPVDEDELAAADVAAAAALEPSTRDACPAA